MKGISDNSSLIILFFSGCYRLEDSQGSPMAEMNKWQRRQTVLCSVVEQLKSKECKMILTALVATKSKLLKKWKSIDVQ